MDRRDFLRSSGLVVMAGAAGFLTAEQYVRGDGPFDVYVVPSWRAVFRARRT